MSKYVDIVEAVFKQTKDEWFMGEELLQVNHITDRILLIEAERVIHADMLTILRNYLNGHVIGGTCMGNAIIIKCGDFK